ncbi:MAG: hypothetical protein GY749_46155 [Desulfobacteraceae bacterium]|nr:hypothetical protein [Desulfobacteraceae bacterium]
MAMQKFPYQDESVFHGTSFYLLSDLFLEGQRRQVKRLHFTPENSPGIYI